MKNKIYYGWIELAVLFALCLLGIVPFFYTFGVVGKAMADELGMSMTAATGAYTLYSVSLSVLAPVHGKFVARFGTRRSMLIGLTVMTVAYLLFATLRRSVLLYYLLWVVCMGFSLRFAGAFACQIAISDWFLRHRALALGIFYAAGGLGGYIFSPVLTKVQTEHGWRAVWLLLAAMSVLCFVLVALLLRDRPPAECEEMRQEENRRLSAYRTTEHWSCGEAMRNLRFYGTVFLFVVSQYTTVAVCNTGIQYLSESGFAPTKASAIIGAYALVSIVGRLLVGMLADHYDTRRIAAAGCAAAAVGMLFMFRASDAASAYAGTALLGLGNGIIMVAPVTILLDYFGTFDSANTISWHSLLGSIISVPFPVILGAIYDLRGGYRPVWLIGCVIFVLCFVMTVTMRPPRKKAQLCRGDIILKTD